jgi:hypothetical protein
MQTPVLDPPLHRTLGHAGRPQLRGGHDAVLALAELGNGRIATRYEKPFHAKDFSCHDANRRAAAPPHPSSVIVFPQS